MINQRRHKRIPITGTVTLKFEDKGEFRSIQSLPGSISLAGLGLYADDPIGDDTRVSITVNFISFDGIKTDSIDGLVVYNRNIGGMYFIGIQFKEEINPDNQPLLYEHIHKILASDK
jgi:hypothetical protein